MFGRSLSGKAKDFSDPNNILWNFSMDMLIGKLGVQVGEILAPPHGEILTMYMFKSGKINVCYGKTVLCVPGISSFKFNLYLIHIA